MTNVTLSHDDPLESWTDSTTLLEMGQTIDGASLHELRRHLRRIPLAPRRLNIDCGSVRHIDPVGAALLWLLCVETERTTGTRISLIGLAPAVVQRLRSHPLLEYVSGSEELFQDPFNSPRPSQR